MGKRNALVIGNGAYKFLRKLPNPVRDAEAVADSLAGLKFDVTLKTDIDRYALEETLKKYRKLVADAEVSLFFYAGHGLQVDGKNYLIPTDPPVIEIDHLSRTFAVDEILETMKPAPYRVVFLDACRDDPLIRPELTRSIAGDAAGDAGTASPAHSTWAINRPKDEGIFIAYATAPGAKAFDGAGEHSPFTAALLQHIGTPGLSLNDLLDKVGESMSKATNDGQKVFRESSLQRRLSLDRTDEVRAPTQGDPPEEVPNALAAATFDAHPAALHCVVVTAESDAASEFDQCIGEGLAYYAGEIEDATRGLRRRRAQDGGGEAGERPHAVVRSVLATAEAFSSLETLRAAVHAICRADVAVFDITKFQPGTMLLLGIRSVARRGVTVCSYGDRYVHGRGLQLPFNLQMLNVAAHSEEQRKSGLTPELLIGRKILRGLRDLAKLPDYMDLPAYDSVRTLEAESVKSIPRREKVLVLCPFSAEYEDRNWRTLQSWLSPKLRSHGDEPRPSGYADGPPPDGPLLARLLDEDTPRLVVQTLYELIRRVDMCVVDWTGLRANVMFELGVRLAVNPLGAVHIFTPVEAARGAGGGEDPNERLRHVEDMRALFRIIEYSALKPRAKSFEEMVAWFASGFKGALQGAGRAEDLLVYQTVGEAMGSESSSASLPIVDELVDRADLLANPDDESSGTSSVLYRDVNKTLAEQAHAAATERRIAAWLYIDARHSDEEIAANDKLNRTFRSLNVQVQRWFNARRDVLDAQSARIEQRMKERMDRLRRSRSAATGRAP